MSDIRRLFNRFSTPFFFLVLLIAAIVANSVISGSQHKDWPTTSAKIVKIEQEVTYDADHDRHEENHVYVQYTVDGKDYDEELGYYEAGYEEGGDVEIRFDPANPRNIEAADISSMLRYFKILIPVAAALLVLTLAWAILRKR